MMTDDSDLPEPSGAPHPIMAYVAELEAALVHVYEFIPSVVVCPDCQCAKDLAYRLTVARAKTLDGRLNHS